MSVGKDGVQDRSAAPPRGVRRPPGSRRAGARSVAVFRRAPRDPMKEEGCAPFEVHPSRVLLRALVRIPCSAPSAVNRKEPDERVECCDRLDEISSGSTGRLAEDALPPTHVSGGFSSKLQTSLVEDLKPRTLPAEQPPARSDSGARCRRLQARIRLLRGLCSTSALPSSSSSGGMYMPNRPRRPFFRPYQPPTGLSSDRPHASTVPSFAGFCSSALPSSIQSPCAFSIACRSSIARSVVEQRVWPTAQTITFVPVALVEVHRRTPTSAAASSASTDRPSCRRRSRRAPVEAERADLVELRHDRRLVAALADVLLEAPNASTAGRAGSPRPPAMRRGRS